MKYLRYLGLALVIAFALYGVSAAFSTIQAKRAAEAEHRAKVEALWFYVTEPVAKKEMQGVEVPMSRGEALAKMLESVIKASKAGQ